MARVKKPLLAGAIIFGATLSFAERIDISSWQMQDAAAATQTGQEISAKTYTASNWYKAVVPGTVLTTLVENKVHPDPYFAKNAYSIPDIAHAKKKYWYRAVFPIPSSFSGKRIWLDFDGINYIAEIFMNGKPVGTMKGAFKRAKYDVTSIATAGGENCCAVLITPPPHTGPSSPYTESYHDKTTTHCHQNGGQLTQDGPTFYATQGWDWILTVPDRDMGLWQEVYIKESGPLAIRFPFIKTDLPLPSTASADVSVSCRVLNATSATVSGILKGVINPGAISFQKEFSVNAAETTTVSFTAATTPALRITNPRLWWPLGYGSPDLYTCQLSVESPAGALSDSTTVRFGVREIEWLKNSSGGLIIGVNGKKILARGGNWGMDEAMKKCPYSRFRGQIRLHALANLNIIRNWVGFTDDEMFYDLCDEYGIMVWDDFWLANGADGPHATDQPLFFDNARDKVLRWRNHPCVVVWNCRNESGPPKEFEDGLRKITTDLDGTRIFIRNSGADGTRSYGPYCYQAPETYNATIGSKPEESFHTELGSANIPVVETMRLMMEAKDLNPANNALNPIWAWHDFCGGAPGANGWNAAQPQTWNNAMNSLYGAASSIEDYCKKSQFLSYVTFRTIFESVNNNYPQKSTGQLLWMSNPSWPSTVWQLYDYFLDPTAGLYGTKSACEPLHIQLDLNSLQVKVMNLGAAVNGLTAEAVIYDPSGAEKWRNSAAVTAAEEKATGSLTLSVPSSISDVYFAKLRLLDGANKTLSSNFYWLSKTSKSYKTAFAGLPQQPLSVSLVSKENTAGSVRMKVSVKHTGTTAPALMIQLKVLGDKSNARILPVFISDNFFCLLPGETKEVAVDCYNDDAKGENPKLSYDGWNIQSGNVGIVCPISIRASAGLLARKGTSYVVTIPAGVAYSIGLFDLAGKRLTETRGIGNGKMSVVPGLKRFGHTAHICVIRVDGAVAARFKSIEP